MNYSISRAVLVVSVLLAVPLHGQDPIDPQVGPPIRNPLQIDLDFEPQLPHNVSCAGVAKPTCPPGHMAICLAVLGKCHCSCKQVGCGANTSVAAISGGPLDMTALHQKLTDQRELQNQLLDYVLSDASRLALYRACPSYKLIATTLVYVRDQDGTHATGRTASPGRVRPLQRFPGDPHDYRAQMISLTNDILLASGACFGLEVKGTVLFTDPTPGNLLNRASCSSVPTDPTFGWTHIENLLKNGSTVVTDPTGAQTVVTNPNPALLTDKNVVVWMSWGRENTDPADPGSQDSQGCAGGGGATIRIPPVPRNIYVANGFAYLGTSHLAHEFGHFLGGVNHPHDLPPWDGGLVTGEVNNPQLAAFWAYAVPGTNPVQYKKRPIHRMVPLSGGDASAAQGFLAQSMQSYASGAALPQEPFLGVGVAPYCSEAKITVGTNTFTAANQLKFNVMSYWYGNQELRRFLASDVYYMKRALAGEIPADELALKDKYGFPLVVNRNNLTTRVINPAQHPALPYAPYRPTFMTAAEWKLLLKNPRAVDREFVNGGHPEADVTMPTVNPGSGPGAIGGVAPH
jgi:hypothetical protein